MAPTEGAYGPTLRFDMDIGTSLGGETCFGANLGRTVIRSRRFGLRCQGALHAFALLAAVCVFVLSLAAHTNAFFIPGGFVPPVGKFGAWKSLLSVPRRSGCLHGKEPSALPRLSVSGLCRLRASSFGEIVSDAIVEVVEEPDPVKQGKVDIPRQYAELLEVAGKPDALMVLRDLYQKERKLDANTIAQSWGFPLDEFQVDAVRALVGQRSVIVSAPTGSGKTVCGEAAVYVGLALGKRVLYTTPLKALSNQKFYDFKQQFGEERVGLLTGDVSVNRDKADIIVLTTEVYRNMLYDKESEAVR